MAPVNKDGCLNPGGHSFKAKRDALGLLIGYECRYCGAEEPLKNPK